MNWVRYFELAFGNRDVNRPRRSPLGQAGCPAIARIVSKNPDRSAQFYSSVFGWSVDAANPLGYRQVSTGAGGLAGGIWPAPAEAHSFVQLFIEVDDVAKATERAKAAGARVLVPPQKLPEGDELAILADPEGVPLGVIARK